MAITCSQSCSQTKSNIVIKPELKSFFDSKELLVMQNIGEINFYSSVSDSMNTETMRSKSIAFYNEDTLLIQVANADYYNPTITIQLLRDSFNIFILLEKDSVIDADGNPNRYTYTIASDSFHMETPNKLGDFIAGHTIDLKFDIYVNSGLLNFKRITGYCRQIIYSDINEYYEKLKETKY